jgi:hypothetical protein
MSRGSIVLPPPAIGADGELPWPPPAVGSLNPPPLPPHLAELTSHGSGGGSNPSSGKLGERSPSAVTGRARMNSVTL